MDARDRILWAQTDKGTRIGTARDTIAALRNGVPRLAWFKQQAANVGFIVNKLPTDATVKAEVNHGRWIAHCPCGGAEEVDWQDPNFYCLSCGNAEVDGRLIHVVFPDDREAIESILLSRPMENRNWLPVESLQDLEAENLEHEV